MRVFKYVYLHYYLLLHFDRPAQIQTNQGKGHLRSHLSFGILLQTSQHFSGCPFSCQVGPVDERVEFLNSVLSSQPELVIHWHSQFSKMTAFSSQTIEGVSAQSIGVLMPSGLSDLQYLYCTFFLISGEEIVEVLLELSIRPLAHLKAVLTGDKEDENMDVGVGSNECRWISIHSALTHETQPPISCVPKRFLETDEQFVFHSESDLLDGLLVPWRKGRDELNLPCFQYSQRYAADDSFGQVFSLVCLDLDYWSVIVDRGDCLSEPDGEDTGEDGGQKFVEGGEGEKVRFSFVIFCVES